jgi:hypothetical protein
MNKTQHGVTFLILMPGTLKITVLWAVILLDWLTAIKLHYIPSLRHMIMLLSTFLH